ncbi:hypothetical protein OBBRIDRAFT_807979 [Obba rivulosa]|uniref:Uncharacterized protein n=1 Tax=Obba rivulosa TaxID=1052685 RepID=A0A8E2AM73_9APHY|nr:hypothetical protein OBBRIDRAFT_807979 [Obba rivulosa]
MLPKWELHFETGQQRAGAFRDWNYKCREQNQIRGANHRKKEHEEKEKSQSQEEDETQAFKTAAIVCYNAHSLYEALREAFKCKNLIAERIQWLTPSEIVHQIQAIHPFVTAAQVHTTWTSLSEVLWKHKKNQLNSAKVLLDEFKPDIDVFMVDASDSVEQIMQQLQEKIIEVGLNATSSSLDIKKHTRALHIWAEQVRDQYGVNLAFVHVNKDMGKIAMVRQVWPAKIQLYWWHLCKVVYPDEHEGEVDDIGPTGKAHVSINSIKIHISTRLPAIPASPSDVSTLSGSSLSLPVLQPRGDATSLKIVISALKH